MKADIAVKDMKSTSQPTRSSPSAITIAPQRTDNDEAITSGLSLYSGTSLMTLVITSPVTVDRTATG